MASEIGGSSEDKNSGAGFCLISNAFRNYVSNRLYSKKVMHILKAVDALFHIVKALNAMLNKEFELS